MVVSPVLTDVDHRHTILVTLSPQARVDGSPYCLAHVGNSRDHPIAQSCAAFHTLVHYNSEIDKNCSNEQNFRISFTFPHFRI